MKKQTKQTKTRIHEYTNELELKSLLIRLKNSKLNLNLSKNDKRVQELLETYKKIYPLKGTKAKKLRDKLKDRIIRDSEKYCISDISYNKFGEIILMMIRRILTKPNFAGYTYKSDFYSDSVYKILKYCHNFDHTKVSEISKREVNAFAYISQIIHNSIIYIINIKNKENQDLKNRIDEEISDNLIFSSLYQKTANESTYEKEIKNLRPEIELKEITNLLQQLKDIKEKYPDGVKILYPHNYIISFDEYNALKPYLKGVDLIKL